MRLSFLAMFVLHLMPDLRGDVVQLSVPAIVRIPAGEFTMGTDNHDLDIALSLCRAAHEDLVECSAETFAAELPTHRVYVAEFGLDRTEVTQAAYRRCAVAGFCSPTRMSETDERIAAADYPVVGVSFADAQRYCEFVGGRLPTEAEWERAARGDTSHAFPWGDIYNPHLANHTSQHSDDVNDVDGYRMLAPVGSYPDAASPFGIVDMAGNVYEWTADYFAEDYYATSPRVNPEGPLHGAARVVRGGSWRSAPFSLLVSRRASVPENTRDIELGFRCAYE